MLLAKLSEIEGERAINYESKKAKAIFVKRKVNRTE